MRARDDTTRAVDSFVGKLAVVTGGGSGIGRELVLQLAAQGCSVAACDLNADTVAETVTLAGRPPRTLVTGHVCDVSAEEQVLRFRDELLQQHARAHVNLVFSNAGISGGHSFIGSFIGDSRNEWERVFAIRWWGVYYCARVFLPLLIASGDGVLVNTSGMNGFWATYGPGKPGSAISTAEFAVKGFTEELIEELRVAAPQVRVAVVMPGWVACSSAPSPCLNPVEDDGRRVGGAERRVVPEGAGYPREEMPQILGCPLRQRLGDNDRPHAPTPRPALHRAIRPTTGQRSRRLRTENARATGKRSGPRTPRK